MVKLMKTAPPALDRRALPGRKCMSTPLSEQKSACSLPRVSEKGCITFIGMAGAGKTTVGRLVARALGWAFVDSDHIIEATFAASLQSVADAMSKEAFIDVEADIVRSLRLARTVLATGGSVVYRQDTMEYLASLGPIVYLDVPREVIFERIARNPDRGLAIAPGQTLADIFYEREALYTHYATLRCDARQKTPQQCARWIAEHLPPLPGLPTA